MTGRLALFRNDKGDNPKRPDYRGLGEITVDGREVPVRLSGWIRKDKKGDAYISMALELDERQTKPAEAARPPVEQVQPGGDEVPF